MGEGDPDPFPLLLLQEIRILDFPGCFGSCQTPVRNTKQYRIPYRSFDESRIQKLRWPTTIMAKGITSRQNKKEGVIGVCGIAVLDNFSCGIR